MRLKYYLTLTLVLLIFSCSNNDKKSDDVKQVDNSSNSDNQPASANIDVPTGTPFDLLERMTQEYFDGFITSDNPFSMIYFNYNVGIDEEHMDVPDKGLFIDMQSDFTLNEENFLSKVLSDIQQYNVYYSYYDYDARTDKFFGCELSSNLIIPIFQLIQQEDYYFNGDEFNGAESRELNSDFLFGHRNYISMHIQQPDQPCGEQHVSKTFCKGWDPGENPPQELMPVINYLENTIIPIMLEHPAP